MLVGDLDTFVHDLDMLIVKINIALIDLDTILWSIYAYT